MCFLSSGGQKSEIQVSAESLPPGGSQGQRVLGLSQLLVCAGSPRRSLACGCATQPPPLPPHGLPVGLHPRFPLPIGMPGIGLRTTLTPPLGFIGLKLIQIGGAL